MPHDYRLAPAVAARFLGATLAGLGVLVFAMTLAVGVFNLPFPVLVVTVLVVVGAVFVIGYYLMRVTFVVRVGEDGYQVRLVRGAGTRRARWTEVENVATTFVLEEPCVVLNLRDGRRTTIPTSILAGDREALVEDIQAQLARVHGGRGPQRRRKR